MASSDPTSRTDDEMSAVVIVTSPDGAEKTSEQDTTTSSVDDKSEQKGVDEVEEAKDAKEDKSEEKKDMDDDDKKDDEDKDSDDEEEREKVVIGMTCEPKNLYQHIDRYNKPFWSDKLPDDLQEAAENEETQKFAVLVRMKRSYDSRKTLEIDSIVIQSPLIKNLLRDVLDGYPGVTTTLARLSFAAPFRPFVHRWQEFEKAVVDPKYDDDTRAHCKILYDVLKEELKDVIASLADYIKNKVISYEHIWTIFVPDTIVYSSRYGHPLAVKLLEGSFVEHQKLGHCFMMKCVCVDYDGYKFGNTNSMHPILPFAGTVPISSLESYPLAFNPDPAAIRTQLIDRGRLFEELAGYHYKSYTGNAIEIDPEYGPSLINMDGRIVIDSAAYCRANPMHKPALKPLKKIEFNLNIHSNDDDDCGYGGPGRNNSFDDYDNPYGHNTGEFFLELEKDGGNRVPLTETELLLSTPMVRGYSLKAKKWIQYFVTQVTPIVFNDLAFESLVLPEGHKSLILAFAQSQVKHKNAFDDVIQGKGKGIIMLLSGGPGIGKTLTAESVAEAMRVPLYTMGSGDIGTASWEIEDKLSTTLELVAKWNAVLLLDECDVFLEERSTHDLDRNKIVSIFLRTLEYYEGIMFLTTNRVENIDPAFDSRIHISLEYPDLDETARKAVWKGFLARSTRAAAVGGVPAEAAEEVKKQDKSPPKTEGGEENEKVLGHDITDEQVDELAKLELNGRIIKNVLKTSNLLAAHRGERLGYGHLQTVLGVGGHLRRGKEKAKAAAKAAAEAEEKENE